MYQRHLDTAPLLEMRMLHDRLAKEVAQAAGAFRKGSNKTASQADVKLVSHVHTHYDFKAATMGSF